MKKVVYNNCFGGFNLSPLAETQYRAKKGIALTWYQGVGEYPYSTFERVTDLEAVSKLAYRLSASTKDLGDKVKDIPGDCYFYKSYHEVEERADPDLIEVIEKLGDRANGFCASLAIAEIPDGADFEIDKHDGDESVVPSRISR